SARTNDDEILTAAYPTDAKIVSEVTVRSVGEAGDESISTDIGSARGERSSAAKVHLSRELAAGVGREIAMVEIAAKEFHLLVEIVIEPEAHGVVAQRFSDAGTKADGVHAI